VKRTPDALPQLPAQRESWTPPKLHRLPPLTRLTLATNLGREDEPELFSFRPGRSTPG
jgi:hypothetical protein